MLPSQAEQQIVDILLRAQEVQYPSAWQDVESQSQNTQLYNVDLASSEVAELMAQVQSSGYHKVLKVCCIILPMYTCFIQVVICTFKHD